MERREYEATYELEKDYWWFRGQRAIIGDLLERYGMRAGGRLLDAGCGTGGNLESMALGAWPAAVGFDISPWALQFLRKRGLTRRVCQASINQIPFPEGGFDAVVSLGVLECAEVDDRTAYSEMWRVLRPGGLMALVVSAHPWLMSAHDVPIHAIRRYTRSDLGALVARRPVSVLRLSHLYPIVFPFVAARRLFQRWVRPPRAMPARSDLRALPVMVNHLLYATVALERRLLRATDFAFGSSLLAVVRKLGDPTG